MIKIGDKCYLKPIGEEKRNCKNKPIEDTIVEADVIKVGKKYFYTRTVKYKEELKFSMEDCIEVSKTFANWKCYFSIQEILDEKEIEDVSNEICRIFKNGENNSSKLSLEKLREIIKIIKG